MSTGHGADSGGSIFVTILVILGLIGGVLWLSDHVNVSWKSNPVPDCGDCSPAAAPASPDSSCVRIPGVSFCSGAGDDPAVVPESNPDPPEEGLGEEKPEDDG